MKLNKNQRYWAELQVMENGKIKVKKAQKLTATNQFTRRWTPVNARNLARVLSQSELVTR